MLFVADSSAPRARLTRKKKKKKKKRRGEREKKMSRRRKGAKTTSSEVITTVSVKSSAEEEVETMVMKKKKKKEEDDNTDEARRERKEEREEGKTQRQKRTTRGASARRRRQSDDERRKKTAEEGSWKIWAPVFILYAGMFAVCLYAHSRYGAAIFFGHRKLGLTLPQWREKLRRMQTTAVLIGGPHRGGTSIVWSCVSAHEKIGAFASRKVADHAEGMFVQDVYPKFGIGEEWQSSRSGRNFARNGLGRYALNEAYHLDERSALNTDENGVKLMNSFGVHWGFKDVASSAKRFEGENKKAEDEIAFVVEKSPPNAIIGTFLRALYKRVGMKTTKHVYVTRHPIANAMALNAMKELNGRVTVGKLLENYIKLHETALRDAKALGEDALYPFRMEDFIREPERKAEEVFSFIFNNYSDEDETAKRRAFDSCVAKIESDTGKPLSTTNPNEKYREQWCKMVDKDESARALSASLAEKYQRKLDELGLGYDIATWCDDDNERINYS